METEAALISRRIGERLRSERHRRGWSLNDLSLRTNGLLSKSRISNYEQGIRRMGMEAAEHLANALETVSPAWLFLLDDKGRIDDEEWRLIQSFRTMDAERRRQLLDTLTSLAPK